MRMRDRPSRPIPPRSFWSVSCVHFLSASVKQSGDPSERQFDVAHDAARTEDHDQDEDHAENDLARPIDRGNREDAEIESALEVAQDLAQQRDYDDAGD